jgi:hypothetical protein
MADVGGKAVNFAFLAVQRKCEVLAILQPIILVEALFQLLCFSL